MNKRKIPVLIVTYLYDQSTGKLTIILKFVLL